ncbi:YqhR family membrane protein [Paenibacillus tengchongensis]|uniref:YqhR family membrane protein n=1 Tax=Paenibacillus tengchongensis TaxID=2608684 RepID=UPI00124BEFC1|nr:YqhR family membrane protein [Paenibacillus tengchongensis]
MSKRNKQGKKQTNPWFFAMELGFFAGAIWGLIRWLLYWLRFTKVPPGFLGEPFFRHDFLVTAPGHLAGYLLFIAFSMIAAMIYVLLFRKLRGPWPGMLYGILWWSALFLGGARTFLMMPPFRLPWNTVTTEFCIFLLWGMFIGYTAAIEFTDERDREQKTKLA